MSSIDTKQLWENTLIDVELNISKANFTTWFKDTHIVKQEDGIIYLGVPSQFVKDWISKKYHKFILKTLRGFSENIRGIEYIIVKDQDAKKKALSQPTPSPLQKSVNELPLENFYINKSDNLNPRYLFETFVVGPFNELAHAAGQAVIKKTRDCVQPTLYLWPNWSW